MHAATKKAGLELTQLVTPTTPQERMKRIAAVSEGFVYLVSVTGQSLYQQNAVCLISRHRDPGSIMWAFAKQFGTLKKGLTLSSSLYTNARHIVLYLNRSPSKEGASFHHGSASWISQNSRSWKQRVKHWMLVTGVTGGRAKNQARVQGLIKLLREVTADAKSVAVGFGVSGPEQVWPFLTSALQCLQALSRPCYSATHHHKYYISKSNVACFFLV